MSFLIDRPKSERYAEGKARRKITPRAALGAFSPPDRDPLALLARSNEGRITSLIGERRTRMSKNPFGFLRGAACLMATDLAPAVKPGLEVQACGDAHLMNFGAFLSPEGQILFDVNDFDETLPGVDFTVDVKRLAASVAVAARHKERHTPRDARTLAESAAASYRQTMFALAGMSPLDAWLARTPLDTVIGDLAERAIGANVRAAEAGVSVADDFPTLEPPVIGRRIADRNTTVFHFDESDDPLAHADIDYILAQTRSRLSPGAAKLLRRYEKCDAAFRAAGVGSVGTFCAIALFRTQDPTDAPLFLQIKEARTSVLEALAPAWPQRQGERVAQGQTVMQGAGDPFLCAARESGRDFYVRLLRTRRLNGVADILEKRALPDYARLCGRTLARAHARSADPVVLAGYMGKSDAFERALGAFAMAYERQNLADYEAFVAG